MSRLRLAKAHLLRKKWEFSQVYKTGRRLRGAGFTLIASGNTCDYSRIGISVHRRLKGAVKRNRIKRIIRESFRLQRHNYPPQADIVIAVRPDFSLKSPDEVTQAVIFSQAAK